MRDQDDGGGWSSRMQPCGQLDALRLSSGGCEVGAGRWSRCVSPGKDRSATRNLMTRRTGKIKGPSRSRDGNCVARAGRRLERSKGVEGDRGLRVWETREERRRRGDLAEKSRSRDVRGGFGLGCATRKRKKSGSWSPVGCLV